MDTDLKDHLHTDRRACFAELLTDVNVLAVLMDTKARIVYCNNYLLGLTGWTFPEIEGKYWRDVFLPNSVHDLSSLFIDLLQENPGAFHQENEIITKAGRRLSIRWNYVLMRDSAGVTQAVGGIGEDVSERAVLQRELAQSSVRARRTIQSELHDGLGQELFGIAMTANSLVTLAQRGTSIDSASLLVLASEANQALQTCRRIAQGLAPLSEVQGGLLGALKRLAIMPAGWQGPAIHFNEQSSGALNLSEEASEHIYKIAQETLCNAIKHSHAKNITIGVDVQPACMVLEVMDDGRGFATEAMTNGVGLKIIRYRAARMHAKLDITSQPDKGTHVKLACEQTLHDSISAPDFAAMVNR